MLRRCLGLSSKGFEIFIEEALRYRGYYENPLGVGRRVKEIAQRCIPDVEVYIFGSVARGRYTAGSDIDVLVVAPEGYGKNTLDKLKAEIVVKVDAPLEVHVATRREFENWYKRFINVDELVRV